MLKYLFALLFLCSSVGYAQSQPASDESIRHLLEVTHASKLLDTVMAQMDSAMKTGMEQALGERMAALSPEQQQTMQNMQTQMAAIFKDTLTWDKLEPVYLKIYRETFTQDEVDGMLAFYNTPAGQALITKMPQALQRTMVEMQQNIGPILQRIRVLQAQTIQTLKTQAAATHK